MKFLPIHRPLALLGLALSLAACSTPENRRELYNTSGGNGPWHDYERRMDASDETGVPPGDMGHGVGGPAGPAGTVGVQPPGRTGRVTPPPKSAPITTDATALPSNAAPSNVPAPANVPASPSAPSSPTTTDPSAPAAPGSQMTAPPADPGPVPPNPPTS